MESIFIVGCGGVGRLLAKAWKKRGVKVHALARSTQSAGVLLQEGITPIAGDLDVIESLKNMPLAGRWVYYCAPPPSSGVADSRMRAFIASLQLQQTLPQGIVYISTSGVYGDCQGAWVDETSKPAPQTDRSKRRLDAEQQLRIWGQEYGVAVIVLRVGGIYGPGRLPLKRLQRGEPLLEPSESPYSNRIHIDDLVTALLAAVDRGQADRVYNICDDSPSTMSDYFLAVADREGIARPAMINMQQAASVVSPVMLSYLTESRRMANQRLREELGVKLTYPDLASGLKHC